MPIAHQKRLISRLRMSYAGHDEIYQVIQPHKAALVTRQVSAENVMEALPVLETVICCVALVVPTPWSAKVNEAGVPEIIGAVPVPLPVIDASDLQVPNESRTLNVDVLAPNDSGLKAISTVQLAPGARTMLLVQVVAATMKSAPPPYT
ncbi:MAG: hypothetical protein WAO76_04520, partial [Georgfuchsia sp.]